MNPEIHRLRAEANRRKARENEAAYEAANAGEANGRFAYLAKHAGKGSSRLNYHAKRREEINAARQSALTAVTEYVRDGKLVRAHVKNGVPAVHEVYGRGIIHPIDYASDNKLVRFVVRGSGNQYTVGRCALAV
jgi:hypothetical protein